MKNAEFNEKHENPTNTIDDAGPGTGSTLPLIQNLSDWSAGNVGRHRARHFRRIWFDYGIFWLGAIVVGLVAVAYAHLIGFGYGVFQRTMRQHLWVPFVVTPLIGGISAWLTRKFFAGAEGSGVPQVIAALQSTETSRHMQMLSLRIVVGKVLVSFIATLGGFTIGRQGPTVQVGAALMWNLRCFFPQQLPAPARAALERRLILAGAASGLAAAFNTPLAGVVFAIEGLSKGFESRSSGVVLSAIIFAGLVALGVDGDYTFFGTIQADSIAAVPAIITVLLTAIVTGVAGGGFAWLSTNSDRWMPATFVAIRTKRPVIFGIGCGGVVALIGFCSGGHTFGSGFAEARGLLQGHIQLPGSYFALELSSLVASNLVGAPGGIFVPSLAVGAGLGDAMHQLFGQIPLQLAVALAMVGYLAAVTHSPITSFVIVAEMNSAHFPIIPLMATALIACTVSKAVTPPLYETLAKRYM